MVPAALVTAATGAILGPDEVLVKKAVLVKLQKQMASLVRGEPTPQPGARDVQGNSCVQGAGYNCEVCGCKYATKQGRRQHMRAIHGPDCPAPGKVFICPHCGKQYAVKNSMREHTTICSQNPDRKGPFYCRVEGCKSWDHAFNQVKNLNAHISSCHGWKECHQ